MAIPAIPIGGIINNQMLIPNKQKPRTKKKHPPRDSTRLDPHLGQGSQISFLAM